MVFHSTIIVMMIQYNSAQEQLLARTMNKLDLDHMFQLTLSFMEERENSISYSSWGRGPKQPALVLVASDHVTFLTTSYNLLVDLLVARNIPLVLILLTIMILIMITIILIILKCIFKIVYAASLGENLAKIFQQCITPKGFGGYDSSMIRWKQSSTQDHIKH